jgi:hypothetical protein
MKKSVRNAIAPNLNAVYEHEHGQDQEQDEHVDGHVDGDTNVTVNQQHHPAHNNNNKEQMQMQLKMPQQIIDGVLDEQSNHGFSLTGTGIDGCDSIDDAMHSLYSIALSLPLQPCDFPIQELELELQVKEETNMHTSRHTRNTRTSTETSSTASTHQHPYDWILDGDDPMAALHMPLQEKLEADHSTTTCHKTHDIDKVDDEYKHVYKQERNLEQEHDSLALASESDARTCSDDNDGELELEHVLSGLELEASCSSESDVNTVQMMQGFRSLLTFSTSEDIHMERTCRLDKTDGDGDAPFSLENDSSSSSSCDSFISQRGGLEDDLISKRLALHVPLPSSLSLNMFRDIQNDHGWMESWNGVPDFLPYQDPSTPEGNFIRRVQVDRDRDHEHDSDDDENDDENENIVSKMDIPSIYFDESRDAVLEILETIPWEKDDTCTNDNEDMLESMDQDTFLIEKLSSLDELSQSVTNTLMQQAKQKESRILQEMMRVQAVDHDITSALSYSRKAATYLQRARGYDDDQYSFGGNRAGALGGNYIIEEADRRDRLRQVDDLIKSIQDLVVMEASVFDFVDNFAANLMADGDGITTLLSTCEVLKNRLLREERFLKLSCLNDSRDRVSHIMEYLCQRIEEELMLFLFRRCKLNSGAENWNRQLMKEYNTLLNARIVFDGYRLQEAKNNNEEESNNDGTTINDFATQWSSIVFDALCFEAERCLPKALLDPTPTNSSDKEGTSDFDSNLLEIRSKIDEIQYFRQDAASIRSLTNNLFSIRLEFGEKDPNVVGMFHRLCSALANVLYAHDQLCRWHEEQIDDTDSRCVTPIPDVETSDSIRVDRIDSTVTKDDYTKSTSSSNCSRSSTSSQPTSIQQRGSNCSNFSAIPQCISGPQDAEDITANLIVKKTDSLQEAILDKRRDLWLHCKGILAKFLDTVFTSNEDNDTSNWSLTWRQDLESLCDIYKLCDQMNSLGRMFLCPEDAVYAIPLHEHSEIKCDLKEAIFRLSETFVSGAHVESMTEVGTTMASETWDLLPIPLHKEAELDSIATIQTSIHSFLSDVETSSCTSFPTQAKVWHNRISRCTEDIFHDVFAGGENPFKCVEGDCNNCLAVDMISSKSDAIGTFGDLEAYRQNLHDKVLSYATNSGDELALASKTALNGLARWSMRLVSIQVKLPIVSGQISNILCNLYDLYFLTVFRLCAGSSGGEAIILGNNKRSDYGFQERFPQDASPPVPQSATLNMTNSFGSRRRGATSEISRGVTSRLVNILVSKYCDADINAPLKSEEDGVARARKFIHRGQAALSTMVSLDQIERWDLCNDEISRKDEMLYTAKCTEKLIAASSSCLFVACLFESCIQKMNLSSEDVTSRAHSPLLKYFKQMIEAISVMHKLSSRMCATRAIMGRRVVSNVSTLSTLYRLSCKLFDSATMQQIY